MIVKRLRNMSIILFITSVIIFGIFLYKEWVLEDQTGPVFNVNDNTFMISVKDDESALLNGITASDAKDGDVTGSIIVEAVSPFTGTGRRIVNYAAFDSDNHVTHAQRELAYSDYTAPRFSLSKPLAFPLNSTNLLEGVRAEDCIDGDITGNIKMMSEEEIDASHVGEYRARLKVSNSAGGVSYLPVIIEIYDSSVQYRRPQISLTNYIVYVDKGSYFDEEEYIDKVTIESKDYSLVDEDGTYGAKYLRNDEVDNTIDYSYIEIDSNVDTDVTGYYEVNYSIEDTESGTGTGTARLYVVITEGVSN